MSNRWLAMASCLMLASGCSAMHPIHGVPAGYMPPEFQAESREGKSTIDLSLLQRTPVDQYRIEAGDVLAVYAPGLLGTVTTDPALSSGDTPPINLPQNPADLPSLGFPVTVRDDHTIQIPQLPPIDVYGLTEREVEFRLKSAVQQAGLLANTAQPRIVVSVMRPRTYRVLVVRQEPAAAQNTAMMSGTIDLGRAGKGTSRVVDLRAYENDVAHALAQPGVDGLPGLDARNVIYVIRPRHRRGGMPGPAPAASPTAPTIRGQSPGRFPTRTAGSHGPFAYLETSQFNLSGRDVARGSTGPQLIDPIPGYNAAAAAPGYGHSVPSGSTANPIAIPRGGLPASGATNSVAPLNRSSNSSPSVNTFSPDAGRYGSVTGHSAAASALPARPPVNNSPHIPIQYTYPQNSPLPAPVGPVGTPPAATDLQPTPTIEHRVPTPALTERNPGPAGVFPSEMPNQAVSQPMPSPPGANPMVGSLTPEVHQGWNHTLKNFDATIESDQIIKIPVRLAPGETLNLSEQDITLYDGDIVFIESRDTDVYFIGGLLGGGQFSLPRDRDLRVLEAVSVAQGGRVTSAGSQGLQSAGGISALNRDVTPSASHLIVLRQVGCGQTMTIEVDLYKALRYPHENILVKPRDMLILQYTPIEATAAFIQRNLFEGALLGIAAGQLRTKN